MGLLHFARYGPDCGRSLLQIFGVLPEVIIKRLLASLGPLFVRSGESLAQLGHLLLLLGLLLLRGSAAYQVYRLLLLQALTRALRLLSLQLQVLLTLLLGLLLQLLLPGGVLLGEVEGRDLPELLLPPQRPPQLRRRPGWVLPIVLGVLVALLWAVLLVLQFPCWYVASAGVPGGVFGGSPGFPFWWLLWW